MQLFPCLSKELHKSSPVRRPPRGVRQRISLSTHSVGIRKLSSRLRNSLKHEGRQSHVLALAMMCIDPQATNDSPCELCGTQAGDARRALLAPDELSRSPGELRSASGECSRKTQTFLAEALPESCNPMRWNYLKRVQCPGDSFDEESHFWISEIFGVRHHCVWMG